jgi:hypothetical protein
MCYFVASSAILTIARNSARSSCVCRASAAHCLPKQAKLSRSLSVVWLATRAPTPASGSPGRGREVCQQGQHAPHLLFGRVRRLFPRDGCCGRFVCGSAGVTSARTVEPSSACAPLLSRLPFSFGGQGTKFHSYILWCLFGSVCGLKLALAAPRARSPRLCAKGASAFVITITALEEPAREGLE